MSEADAIKRLNLRMREIATLAFDRGMTEASVVDLICAQLPSEDIVVIARNAIEHQVARASEQRDVQTHRWNQ